MDRHAGRAAPRNASDWLFNPWIDLLAGCGVGYGLVFVALVARGPTIMEWVPITLIPLLSLVAGAPHYGATLLRVYRTAEARERYAAVATRATILIGLAFLVALRWHVVGTALLTLYLLWSPWHYSRQNYGLAMMFLGRRGLPLSPRTKSALHWTFALSFLLTIVQMNGEAPGSLLGGYALSAADPAEAYRVVSLGLPSAIQNPLFATLLVAWLGAVGYVVATLLQQATLGRLAPVLCLIGTQSLWFAIPALAQQWQLAEGIVPLEARSSVYAFQWVAAAHAVQYIWVTIYFNNRSATQGRPGRFYFLSLLAGNAIWTVPLYVFAPAAGAHLAISPSLALLVAAVVNLHHFILDGAIWKLRDERVKSVLVPGTASRIDAEPSSGLPWPKALLYALALVFPVAQATDTVAHHLYSSATERNDLRAGARALAWLDRVGRTDATLLIDFGYRAEQSGDTSLAFESYARSADALDNAGARYELARLHLARSEWRAGADEFERAYALSPSPPALFFAYFSEALIRADRLPRAREVLERGARAHPGDPEIAAQRERLDALVAEGR